MSMQVKIRMGGSLIVYDKDENWNFVFITDEKHLVKVLVNRTPWGELRVPERSRMLRLGVPKGSRQWVADSDRILNMGDPNLHGNVQVNSHLEVLSPPGSPKNREIVRLLVPSGTVEGTKHIDENGNDIWYPAYEYGEYGGPVQGSFRDIAKYLTLSFQIEGPLMLIEGTKSIEVESYKDGQTLEVEINNDCECTGHEDDFLMYYDWVRDTTDSGKKFVARKPSGQIEIKSIEGNCDPTRIVPPPFP